MSLAYRISAFNRRRKWSEFLENIRFDRQSTLLDVGYTDKEYSSTDNYIHKHYPYPGNVTALGIEEPLEFSARYPAVRIICYDGRIFPFQDNAFDICWSNAVLEHVGSREQQVLFVSEIARTSRTVFLTTPNRRFPFEIHTRVPLLHFLPKPLFDWFLKVIGKDWATGTYMNLLSLRELKELLERAGIREYKIISNRFLFFTMDFVVIWRRS